MATVLDIVTAAARRAKLVAFHEEPEADDAAAILGMFNRMLYGWKAFGVDVSHSDQALTDTLALDDRFQEGTVFLLAQQVADEYGLGPVQMNGFITDNWWRMIRAHFFSMNESTVDAGLKKLPSQYSERKAYR